MFTQLKYHLISAAAGFLLGAGAVWFMTGPSETAELSLPDTITTPVGKTAVFSATSRGAVTWFLPPYPNLKVAVSGNQVSVTSHVVDDYWVGATTRSSKGINPPIYTRLVFEGTGPTPPEPVPPPKPDPDPPLTPVKLWVIVVHDPSRDTPDFAALVDSPSLRKALSDKGHKFRMYSAKKADLSLPGWKAALTKAGKLPAIIFMDQESAKLRDAVPLPETEQGIVEATKKAGGI